MQNLLILLMVLFVTACGTNKVAGISTTHIDMPLEMREDFSYFMDVCMESPKFRGHCHYAARTLESIKYVDYAPESHVIGTCFVYSEDMQYITISSSYYKSTSAENKRSLLVHELLHCVIGARHSNDTKLMSPWQHYMTMEEIDDDLKLILSRGF